ncbi:MAG: polymerase, partial [Pseudomonadota bacterium]|jgi:DNA polymerase-4
LAAQPRDWLMAHFGKTYGAWLHDAAHGRDERPIVTESEPVSMSRETTFERDLHAVRDRETLGALFTRLCEQVAADLQRKGYVGRTIGVKLRYDNFKIVTRDQSIEHHTADPKVLRQVAGQCLKRVDLSRKLRLLGVRVGSLLREGEVGVAAATGSGLSPVAAEALPGLQWGHEQTDLLFPDD